MDVYVNGRFLNRPTTGVERYAGEVLARLQNGVQALRPARAWRGGLGHLWEQLVLPARLPGSAMLWSPANTGPLRVRRQVLTVHDIAPLDHPEWFRPEFASWYGWLLPRLAQKVTKILTDSEFSRARIVSRLGVEERRVEVIAPGVGPPFGPVDAERVVDARERYGLEVDYLLAVGTDEPRKNLGRLARAWQAASPALPEVVLALAGGTGAAFPAAGQAHGGRIVRLGRVPDNDLAALYAGARMLVYVPLYEGFGLPPLEAMACGCPVLASAAEGVSEAVGTCAQIVDPLDGRDIADGILKVAKDRQLRSELTSRGLVRAGQFSWERTAQAVSRSLEAASQAR